MKYLYGPVHSRRLGSSLGISLLPHKTCNFNCVYCQLGRTVKKTSVRRAYVASDAVMRELLRWIRTNPRQAEKLDFITFSGAGEPTLHSGIGRLIQRIKRRTGIPVCVITNASLLSDKLVRKALFSADLVIPSLDAPDSRTFRLIDRPAAGIGFAAVLAGLIRFSREYRGKLWLEIMIVKGYNDSLEHARALKYIVSMIKPQRVQLNSPVRHTAQPGIFAADRDRLEKIKKILGPKAELV